ncbi:MAG: response regulator [Spirochaetes bacterium]|nr:response regulator [Spirochaetota bacterium]
MPRNINLLIILILTFFGLSLNGCYGINQLSAQKGVLDLREADFSTTGPLEMKGEWEFYWCRLLSPGDFSSKHKPEMSGFITLPSTWNGFIVNGRTIHGDGYATYRLRVRVGDHPGLRLAIKIPDLLTAYDLWVNGILVASNGKVGTSRNSMTPQIKPQIVVLPSRLNDIDIILRVSNFFHRYGGAEKALLIGTERQIIKTRELLLSFEMFLFGAILVLSVYYLWLYLLRKEERSFLFFSLFCLFASIRLITTGEHFIILIFPDIPWQVVYKLGYISIYLAIPAMAMFLKFLYPSQFSRIALRIIQISCSSMAIIVATAPARIYTWTLEAFEIITVATCIYTIYILIISMLKKIRGTTIILVGFIALFSTGLNDILYSAYILPTMNLFPFGLFIFVLSHSFLLSKRYSTAFNEVESLSEKLQDLTENLEMKVHERTRALDEANIKLNKSDQQKTYFFTNLSHEIKTPLTLILNYMNKYTEKHGVTPEITIINKNINKLLSDMINLFDVLKFERGMIVYNHDSLVDLSDSIEQKSELYKSYASSRDINITFEIEKSIIIKADPFAVERIINNVLDNAIRYNNNGGSVGISLKSENDRASLTICDTGVGIQSDRIQNIFEPYYQIPHEKRNLEGIGMGLSIVRSIVDSLQGTIDMKSEPGMGTELTIIFNTHNLKTGDIISKEYQSCMPIGLTTASDGSFDESKPIDKSVTILIVEDNADLMNLMHNNLNERYNVYCALNGKDAIAKIDHMPIPDVIISDIMMDEMNGVQFFEAIKKRDNCADIPFIFITAKTDLKLKVDLLKKGAFDYLYKPFVIEEMISKIDSIINYNDLRKKMYEKDKFTSLGMLMGGISHEIFNPLSGINGPLANLKKHVMATDLGNNSKVMNYFEHIEQSTKKIERIINSIRTLYGTGDIETGRIDIASIVSNSIEKLRKYTTERIHYVLDLPDQILVTGNAEASSIVFDNLLSNAVDAIEGTGTITVSLRDDMGSRILEVSDTGTGITAEQQKLIFNPFYSTKKSKKGIGLGLNIVKHLVIKQNWEITVKSSPGFGTTFFITMND